MSGQILVILMTGVSGELTRHDLETIGLGRELAQSGQGTLSIGLIGANLSPATEAVRARGARTLYTVDDANVAESRYATDVAAVRAIVDQAGPTLVMGPANTRWSRCAAGLAQRIGGAFDAQVTGVRLDGGALSVDRWFYRQRIKGTLSRTGRPWVLSVAAGAAVPTDTPATPAEVVDLSPALPPSRTRVTGIVASSGNSQTIKPEADILLVAGAGWTKKQADGQVHAREAESIILEFLEKADASLGSSKSLVDLGSEGQEVLPFLTHLHQIGQTGATPRHPKGLSTCCHGEEPHAVGWRFINERRAISLDANCGWAHGKADVLYVADAFEVMRQVNELL